MNGLGLDKDALNQYIRATDYLSVAQIFLKDNFLLDRPLDFNDIKPRLLGHFGTCPGINKAYAHLLAFIKRHDLDMMFILGPGHGFPALQANLFLEGSLNDFYSDATQNLAGIECICKGFSWPDGFPSHASPAIPGVISEGGELGYSLATAYGSVLDNPGLITACLIGDGEAETGALLASLNLNKLISPKTNGVVLPILHLNGYKISAPTIYGRMSDKELVNLFSGFGYEPIIVDSTDGSDFHDQMYDALERSYQIIKSIKENYQDKFFRLPFIIMKTQKGATGPKELNGEKIAGNYLSHQVILTEAKTNKNQLEMLESWLKSYRFNELYDKEAGFGDFVERIMPRKDLRMGLNKNTFGRKYIDEKLKVPAIVDQDIQEVIPGETLASSAQVAGKYLRDIFEQNEEAKNFRFFSPDETSSNKLDYIFEATDRQWLKPLKDWDKYMAPSGRVTELLSENTLQGLLTGYILTGRYGALASYEAFLPIITSMVDQYVKFVDQAKRVEWRSPLAAMNLISTSVGWRQDHNGFSHQSPGFISNLLLRPSNISNVFLPVDDVSTLSVMEFCFKTKNVVNLSTMGKTDEPRWIDINHARFQIVNGGASIFQFASDEDPQLIIATAGDYVTKEALAAVQIVKNEIPDIRLRFANVVSLSYGAIGTTENKLPKERFNEIFTADKPIIFSFHGYTETIKSILVNYTSLDRLNIHGFCEKGSTTTPFNMQVLNGTSRYHLAMSAFKQASLLGIINSDDANGLCTKYQNLIAEHQNYIKLYGIDSPEIRKWQWNQNKQTND